MSGPTSYHTIVTHPGSAHKDDLLACCVLLAKHPAPIERREPTAADLANPQVAVVDVGDSHDPERGNFDHHQFPRDAVPTCSLSLVLRRFGLYEDARQFCEWLETAEWFDCRGPNHTAAWLGVDREVVAKLNSPVDITLMRRFALADRHEPGQPLWEVMKYIGEDLIDYLTNLRLRLNYIDTNSQLWPLGEIEGSPRSALFLPREEPLPEEPSAGIGHYLREKALEQSVIVTIYPDRRSSGYGISRYNDHPAVDFTRIETEPDVHFAHKSGFVAKTTATDPDRLLQLARQGVRF